MGQDRTATLGTDSAAAKRPRLPVRWLVKRLERTLASVDVRLQLWNGQASRGSERHAIGTVVISDPQILPGLILNPDLRFGEAYTSGQLQILGNVAQVMGAIYRLSPAIPSWRERVQARWAPAITSAAARRNAQEHYDLGNDFYRLWLDQEMVYTCAYFPEPHASLEEAQRYKLDVVCRKLQLQPGEQVLETGCGWGALALHMAREFGVTVTAYNVSHEQIAYARQRAAREHLGNRVTFIQDDYRAAAGQFDAFVSIGMLEHVGRRRFRDLGEVIRRTLRPASGRGLLHFIGRDNARPLNRWIRRRIFPEAYPPTLAEVTSTVLSASGMSVIDVENLRPHYARTCAHWGQRFAGVADQVRAAYGESFRRAWELYLAGSEAAFVTGSLQLFQVVFAPIGAAPPVLNRADLYSGQRPGR